MVRILIITLLIASVPAWADPAQRRLSEPGLRLMSGQAFCRSLSNQLQRSALTAGYSDLQASVMALRGPQLVMQELGVASDAEYLNLSRLAKFSKINPSATTTDKQYLGLAKLIGRSLGLEHPQLLLSVNELRHLPHFHMRTDIVLAARKGHGIPAEHLRRVINASRRSASPIHVLWLGHGQSHDLTKGDHMANDRAARDRRAAMIMAAYTGGGFVDLSQLAQGCQHQL